MEEETRLEEEDSTVGVGSASLVRPVDGTDVVLVETSGVTTAGEEAEVEEDGIFWKELPELEEGD